MLQLPPAEELYRYAAFALLWNGLAIPWAWAQADGARDDMLPTWWALLLSVCLLVSPWALVIPAPWWTVALGPLVPACLVAWHMVRVVAQQRRRLIRNQAKMRVMHTALQGLPPEPTITEEEDLESDEEWSADSEEGTLRILSAARRLERSQRLARLIWEAPCLVLAVNEGGTVVSQYGGALREMHGLPAEGWEGQRLSDPELVDAHEQALEGRRTLYTLQWGGVRFRGVAVPLREATRSGVQIAGSLFIAVLLE